MAEKDQAAGKINPVDLLKNSKFVVKDLQLEAVPYSVAVQAVALAMQASTLNQAGDILKDLSGKLKQIQDLKSEITK